MSIGSTLALARRQAGLTITQVSQQTRIREPIISSIEQGDFSACGGDFYARGHIRSIAGAVGIDPAVLIRDYEQEHGPPAAMGAAQIFESVTPIRIRERRSPRLGWVLAIVVVVAGGFAIYHYAFGTPGANPAATGASRVSHIAKPKPGTSVKPAARTAMGPPQAVIRVIASQDCWVGLSTPTGRSLYQGLILAGSTMTWHEKHALSMVIGNPLGITLTVNGKPEQMDTVQVVTLSIDPLSKTPVTVG